MRVLVTRPEPGAAATARVLRERGYKVIVDPALKIERLSPELPPPDAVDVVLVTSAQAAFALGPYRHKPVLAVGEATARAARREGALDVTAAAGDWEDLADLALDRGKAPQRFLHLVGSEQAGELDKVLRAEGHGYAAIVVYRASPSDALTARTKAALSRGGIDAVTLFSPRSARIWRSLIEAEDFADTIQDLIAVCLSPAVAAAIDDWPWREVRTAERRDQNALLDCLDDLER